MTADDSDHFDGKRYFNRSPSARMHTDLKEVAKWMMTRKPDKWRRVDEAPGPKPEERVDGGEVVVTFVGHATVLVQQDGLNMLTDPIWADRCSPVGFAGPKRFRKPAIRFDDLPPIDVVLLSHDHYDHLCVPTLKRLQYAHDPLIITGLGVGAILKKHGILRYEELDWWSHVDVPLPGGGAARVTFTEAQHFSGRGATDRDRTLWGGLYVDAPSGGLYYAGDTGYGPHFVDTARRLGSPRTAILPIGAFAPRWFMAPVHMDPQQAVQAHLELGARTSVAVHYGTFNLADDGQQQPITELGEALGEAGLSAEVFRTLPHGVATRMPRAAAVAAAAAED